MAVYNLIIIYLSLSLSFFQSSYTSHQQRRIVWHIFDRKHKRTIHLEQVKVSCTSIFFLLTIPPITGATFYLSRNTLATIRLIPLLVADRLMAYLQRRNLRFFFLATKGEFLLFSFNARANCQKGRLSLSQAAEKAAFRHGFRARSLRYRVLYTSLGTSASASACDRQLPERIFGRRIFAIEARRDSRQIRIAISLTRGTNNS